MSQKEIFLERLEGLIAESGESEHENSLRIFGNKNTLRSFRRFKNIPRGDNLDRVARGFQVSVDYLLGNSDARAPVRDDAPRSNAALADKRVAWRDPSGMHDLPVLGTALGASLQFHESGEVEIEQTILEPTEVLRYLPRPAALAADRYAYAFYVQGDSMMPAFKPGKLGVATTRKPPEIGDNVIVQLVGALDGEDEEVVSVLIKELVKRTASWIELRQHNPPCTFRVPRERIRHLHRVLDVDDLIGG